VGFCGAYHILERDNVFWNLLLMFVSSESTLKCTIIILVMSNMYLYCVLWMITYMLWMVTWVQLLLQTIKIVLLIEFTLITYDVFVLTILEGLSTVTRHNLLHE
jgi:hypothetical protein